MARMGSSCLVNLSSGSLRVIRNQKLHRIADGMVEWRCSPDLPLAGPGEGDFQEQALKKGSLGTVM